MSKIVTKFYHTNPLSVPNVRTEKPENLSLVGIEPIGYRSEELINCCFCPQRQKHNYGSLLVYSDGSKAPCGICCAEKLGFGLAARKNEREIRAARRAEKKLAELEAAKEVQRKRAEDIRLQSEALAAPAIREAKLAAMPLLRIYAQFKKSKDYPILECLALHSVFDPLNWDHIDDVNYDARNLGRTVKLMRSREDSQDCIRRADELRRNLIHLFKFGQDLIDGWVSFSEQSDKSKRPRDFAPHHFMASKKSFQFHYIDDHGENIKFADLRSIDLKRYLEELH